MCFCATARFCQLLQVVPSPPARRMYALCPQSRCFTQDGLASRRDLRVRSVEGSPRARHLLRSCRNSPTVLPTRLVTQPFDWYNNPLGTRAEWSDRDELEYIPAQPCVPEPRGVQMRVERDRICRRIGGALTFGRHRATLVLHRLQPPETIDTSTQFPNRGGNSFSLRA